MKRKYDWKIQILCLDKKKEKKKKGKYYLKKIEISIQMLDLG